MKNTEIRMKEANDFASAEKLPLLPTQFCWLLLTLGVEKVYSFSLGDSQYQNLLERLVSLGIVDLENKKIFYKEESRWERGDGPQDWFITLVKIASGEEVPETFFTNPALRG